jgi:hypothetical protein
LQHRARAVGARAHAGVVLEHAGRDEAAEPEVRAEVDRRLPQKERCYGLKIIPVNLSKSPLCQNYEALSRWPSGPRRRLQVPLLFGGREFEPSPPRSQSSQHRDRRIAALPSAA